MTKQVLWAAALITLLCSCDSSTGKNRQNDSSDSVITGPGVGYDTGTDQGKDERKDDRPIVNNDYPNRRKHTLLRPYLASIQAYVEAVKFFEGPYNPPPKEQRQYHISFDRQRSRYINWELNLTHKAPGQTLNFTIDSEWYRDGKLFYRQAVTTAIDPDWEYSYHSHGYNLGKWIQGIYRVDLTINGQKVASEFFDIYNADCSGDLMFTGADAVDELRRQADSYRNSGNDSQYQDALLRLGVALHNRAGQCYLNGHLDAAIEDLTEAIRVYPSFPSAYYHRALVSLDLKKAKEALSDLDTAIQSRNYEEYFAARARAQFFLENDPEALSDLTRAIEINSKHANFYHERGIVWYYLGEDQNALSDLKQAASVYQSKNDQDNYQKVIADIDILEGRSQGILKLKDTGRLFTLAEIKNN